MPSILPDKMLLNLCGFHSEMSQAECYRRGLYVERDEAMALRLYTEAASKGVPGAHFKIALIHHHRKPCESVQAREAYLKAAFEGDLSAKTALQELLLLANPEDSGFITFYIARAFEHEGNWLKAQEWYIKAGTVEAIYSLGALYHRDRLSRVDGSIVIAKNKAEELRWYKQAAAFGHEAALLALKAEVDAKALASLYLAQLHELGVKGCPTSQAIVHYKEASALANADASFRLAQIAERGELGALPNRVTAFESYLLAVKQGHLDALTEALRLAEISQDKSLDYQLAEFYQNFIKNKVLSLRWYKNAIDKGNQVAVERLNEISKVDPEMAYAAAKLYEEDTHGKKNVETAIIYYAMAIRKDHFLAKERISFFGRIKKRRSPIYLGL